MIGTDSDLDPFFEYERALAYLERINRRARWHRSIRRLLLAGLLAGSTVLTSIVLGTTKPSA